MNLGAWLRKTPQPHSIDVDGKKVTIGNGGGKWRDAVRTIETLKGEKITALDSAGNVIRAFTIEDEEEETARGPAPTSDIQVFAGLIADAYQRGHTTQQPMITQSLEYVERISARLVAAERECDRLRHVNMQLQRQILEMSAEGAAPGEGSNIIEALMQGAAAAALGNGVPGVPAARPQRPARPSNGAAPAAAPTKGKAP